MALIKCTECGKDISSKAISCPNCGNPISSLNSAELDKDVVTIQLTQKKWKKHKLISTTLLIIGFIMIMNGLAENSAFAIYGFFLVFIGFLWALVAKFGAWWTTG